VSPRQAAATGSGAAATQPSVPTQAGSPARVGNVGGVSDPEAPLDTDVITDTTTADSAVPAGVMPANVITDTMPVDTMPANTMPADTVTADTMTPDTMTPDTNVPADTVTEDTATIPAPVGFQVKLTNFSGPFDLLLQLIGKQKLEITELSLSQVTDEFIAYIRAMGDNWDLDEVSEFLVVAATLLDLKAAKLLPQAEVEDDEDLALLEARDLLFARLLQYKAFKEAANVIAALDAESSRGYPRAVKLEAQFAEALPELVLGIGTQRLAQLAVKAFGPKPIPVVAIDHVHMVRVSVREHLGVLRDKLLRLRLATFRALCADCQSTLEVVARFLALLELYREGLVEFDQMTALGELTVRWIGDDSAGLEITIDEYSGAEVKPVDGGEPDDAEAAGAPDADAADTDVTGTQARETQARETQARDTDAGEGTRG
jgi:segregation and condensation protein A